MAAVKDGIMMDVLERVQQQGVKFAATATI